MKAQKPRLIVGVDPGYTTGICLIDDRCRIVTGCYVEWEIDELWHDYAVTVCDTITELCDGNMSGTYVRIEDVVKPVGHLGKINPLPTINTARLIGYLQAKFERVAQVGLVRPGGHGSRPLQSYPSLIVGDRETVGTSKLKHVRSAYDVAMALDNDRTPDR